MAMFAKNLASSFGAQRHPLAAAAAVPSPPFPRIILLKLSWLSTTIAGNDRPTGYPEAENTCPLSEFLLNECGLCQSELSAILKKRPSFVATRSTHTAQEAVQFLRDSGLTEDRVRKIIIRNPVVLTCKADRQWKPKVEFMKTLGLTAEDFRNVIYNEPRFLISSLEKTLCPNIQYLQNLFGSEANVSKVFKLAPQILHKSNGPECWEKQMKHLTSFGLQEDEIKELVRRHPRILNVSMDKVQKMMDFFMRTAGLPAKFLLKYPQLLYCFNLECRIKPRHKVLSALSSMQPSNTPPSLINALYLNEPKFLEKYVHCSPHAAKLLEIYSGKLAVF